MIAGLVLAGGRSLRFGSDKALAKLGGRTLLEIAVTRLSQVCGETAVSAPAGGPVAALAERLGTAVVEDPPAAPRGPLSGVLAGLEWAQSRRASLLITLPCDVPLLPDDFESRLVAAAEGAVASVARTPGGLHPLCAAWSPGMTRALRSALANGLHPAAHQILGDAGAVEVVFPNDEPFINLNTREELAEAERRMAGSQVTGR
jgi:molybdopterin-guanine dinucleotide biosynthesis protein A